MAAGEKKKNDDVKKISSGEVAKGTDDPTANSGQKGQRTAKARPVATTNIVINPGEDDYANPRFTYKGNRGTVRVGAQGYNPNDSIGNASRAASARFEARGEAMRQRIAAEAKMSPHEKAMSRNPRFAAMYNEVQKIAAQDKAAQNARIQAFSKGDVSNVGGKFNKSEWAAAGAGDKINPADAATQAKIAALNEWKDRQWTTTYDSKTGKSFNRYNENFDASRIGGALTTDATGKQSFDFNNMTAAQLDMLTNVMKEDQAATGKATRDMNVAMANNKQQAVGQATDLLVKNGHRLKFDQNGKRIQSDEEILAAANALRKDQALATINGMTPVRAQLNDAKTPQEFAGIAADNGYFENMNNAFRQLTLAGVDPTVARHAVGGAGSDWGTQGRAINHIKPPVQATPGAVPSVEAAEKQSQEQAARAKAGPDATITEVTGVPPPEPAQPRPKWALPEEATEPSKYDPQEAVIKMVAGSDPKEVEPEELEPARPRGGGLAIMR